MLLRKKNIAIVIMVVLSLVYLGACGDDDDSNNNNDGAFIELSSDFFGTWKTACIDDSDYGELDIESEKEEVTVSKDSIFMVSKDYEGSSTCEEAKLQTVEEITASYKVLKDYKGAKVIKTTITSFKKKILDAGLVTVFNINPEEGLGFTDWQVNVFKEIISKISDDDKVDLNMIKIEGNKLLIGDYDEGEDNPELREGGQDVDVYTK